MAGAAVRAIPWARVLLVARTVLDRFGEDIPKRDRQRLTALLRKSKGDPRRLSARERHEIWEILRQLDLTKLGKDLAGVAALAKGTKLLKPGR